MSEIEQIEQQLEGQFAELEKELKVYARKDNSQKQKYLKKCEEKCKTISYTIEALELEISSLDRAEKAKHTEQLKAHQKRFKDFKNDIEFKKSEITNTKSLFQEKTVQKDIQDMNAQELQEYGNKLQDKGEEALDNILVKVDDANDIATRINLELYDQTDKLQNAYDNAKNLQSTQKKNERILKYFEKNLQCDWCMMVMICLILIAIIAIIVIAVTKKSSKIQFPSDVESLFKNITSSASNSSF